MAPSFLSKLVRAASPTHHNRDQSNVSPIPRSRAQSATTPFASVNVLPPTPKTSKDSKTDVERIPTVITTPADGRASQDSGSTTNVIVVPPSPRVVDSDISSTSSSRSLVNTQGRRQTINDTNSSRGRTITKSASRSTISLNEDNLPTPTAAHPLSPRSASKTRSRPSSPSASTTNLKETAKKEKAQKNLPPPMPSRTLEPTTEVRKRSSNRSLNPPPPITISHNRGATTPDPRHEASNIQEEKPAPLVESPTAMRYPSPPPTLVHAATVPAGSSSFLSSPSMRDADSASIISKNGNHSQTREKKRPWRKTSNASRKPTGLASAIAASGLAMANHSLTPAQQAQFAASASAPPPLNGSARKSSNPGSPPYMSSRNASSRHVKNRSAELSPRSSKSNRSRRRKATSVASDNNSEHYDDRPEYYSGLEEGSSDEDDSGSEDDLMDLDLGEDDFPVTGFAVASNKRNADFHELFPSVPEGDYLIEDYGCALQREILIQGRIYISENHICFHANIFGWITDLLIPINEITLLEKKMTAFVIPNGIQITTRQAKYNFASFLSRDTTYDVIYNIWKLERPDDASITSGPRGSFDHSLEQIAGSGIAINGSPRVLARKQTQCLCGKEGKHFSETALETVLTGTPDKIHNLIFASGFMKEFMAVNQKLLDIQMSDWAPTAPGSHLLTRNMSYIKPLNGSLGPKQTKCEIRDEMLHCDFDDYVVTLTTTRTPDVPSGGVFSVKTRTCIMFASAVSTRVIVTTQVEWTGRSFIKGIIERSAIDGQKVYHADLEIAMRAYIQEHQAEFIPAGIDPAAITLVEAIESADESGKSAEPSSAEVGKLREHERNTRALQWAWDTFDGAYHVAKQSTKGAIELITDAWEQSSSTTILIFVIVILVFSNLWTLMRMGSRVEEGRRKEIKKAEERDQFVQGVVSALGAVKGLGPIDQVVTIGGTPQTQQPAVTGTPRSDWRDEVKQLMHTLDAVENRVRAIRENIKSVVDKEPSTLD